MFQRFYPLDNSLGMHLYENVGRGDYNRFDSKRCGCALISHPRPGSIEVGKSGDVVILEFENYRMLPYYVGMNCVNTVISRGRIVAHN